MQVRKGSNKEGREGERVEMREKGGRERDKRKTGFSSRLGQVFVKLGDLFTIPTHLKLSPVTWASCGVVP